VLRPDSAEAVITLKGEQDGEKVQQLLRTLSAVPGVLETDYNLLTRKVIVKYDPNVLTHLQIVEKIDGVL
jgi:copper chaperone CopZ